MKYPKYLIRDAGALNGIFVNDKRINSHVLSDGDVVQFGGFYDLPVGTVLSVKDVSIRYIFKQNLISSSSSMGSSSKKKSSKRRRDEETNNSLYYISSSNNSQPILQQPQKLQQQLELELEQKYQAELLSMKKKLQEEHEQELKKVANDFKNENEKLKQKIEKIEKIEKIDQNLVDKNGTNHKNHSKSASAASSLSPQMPPPAPRTPASSSQTCKIDVSSLRSNLICILCDDLLVDAVVIKCSHGFCRSCLEVKIHEGKSLCPVCHCSLTLKGTSNRSIPPTKKGSGHY
jgi:pSer/pThr/pTyr-binding forkhead associated (FHA) protein